MNNTLLATVFYPGTIKYLSDYFNSVMNQKDECFDILLICDQVKFNNNEYVNLKNLNIIYVEDKSIAGIREVMINYAIEKKYQNLIFSDIDDFFDENRIEFAKKALIENDIYVNNLKLVNESGNYIPGKVLDDSLFKNITIETIINKNIIGMSNSAIKVESIPGNFFIPDNIIAVDWWLYSVLLLNNKKLFFDKNVVTFYRQHQSNFIGFRDEVNEELIRKGIAVKKLHYLKISEYCKEKENNYYYDRYNKLFNSIVELEEMLTNSSFFYHYIEVINKNKNLIKKGWWNEILTLKELSVYE